MPSVVISGTGIYLPPSVITNEELVNSFNRYVRDYNQFHKEAILSGVKEALKESNVEFIVEASGIKKRHAIDKEGILDTNIMRPRIVKRANTDLSVQAEMAFHAAKKALACANRDPDDIDAVIVACSNVQRPYPALAIEVQSSLGASGFAYDLNAACSSASFGLTMARSLILSKMARCVLVVNPELYTAHLNFKDRRSHFIFGDGCSAAILESAQNSKSEHAYEILDCKLQTRLSNNIRNNFGFLSRNEDNDIFAHDNFFVQHGKLVRSEVIPFAANHITTHLNELGLSSSDVKRLWLHQANVHMDHAIARNVWRREVTNDELPLTLSKYGNTGAAGVMMAFHECHQDLAPGSLGVLCSFGAGYTVGSIVLKKI